MISFRTEDVAGKEHTTAELRKRKKNSRLTCRKCVNKKDIAAKIDFLTNSASVASDSNVR